MSEVFEAIKEYAFINIMVAAGAQFLRPFLAGKIQRRFKELGVSMKSSAANSWLNVSLFWGEARKLNESCRDEVVARYLKYNRCFWIYFLFFVLLFIISNKLR